MILNILAFSDKNVSRQDFIDFWSKYYVYTSVERLYLDRIHNEIFSKDDIEKLFEWKNGMKINGHKQKQASVDKIVSRLKIINELKNNFDFVLFKRYFNDLGAIWQLFILHIIQPEIFPIFDQHVYRAHLFISKEIIEDIKEDKNFKLKYFYEVYLPFYNNFKTDIGNDRQADMALWAFGKFLKTQYAIELIPR